MTSKMPHEWSSDALMAKAQRFATKMLEQSREDWQFGFWSSLCLEMLVRAAVAAASPALLADAKDWNNVAFSLGMRAAGNKQSPKSIDVTEAAARAEALYPAFTREMVNFCAVHFQRRNAELHSGALAFDELGTSWLPQFYACCEVLLEVSGATLTDLVGLEEAATASTLVKALRDDAAKAVKGTINAHQTVWQGKDDEERTGLSEQATAWASRSAGHRVPCPACTSTALLQGTPAGPSVTSMQDELIVTRTPMLPSHFECMACRLKISGFSKLNACGLGDTYTSTAYDDPVEYFGVEPEIRYIEAPMEEDNNEP
tara:strand:+ start:2282 stop:3226 length:945 start_codon:yes stop_codon:yes gene_type:complete